MRASLIFISFLIYTISANAQLTVEKSNAIIIPGAYNFEAYYPLLKDKRFALAVNQTSMVNNTHLVDTLLKMNGLASTIFSPNQSTAYHDMPSDNSVIKKVFSPEHGFRGDADAGEKVKDGIDITTNLPVVSLYGSNKKPTPEQLEDIDVVVFDVQDVGTRFYTYISTMHYIMEACAESGKQVIILDRPNPNGMYVDGPVLDMEYQSFVGMHPIPILHGLTVGELALMINGERWLKGGIVCDLKVIPVQGWDHSSNYSLPIKPSPNLPNDLSIQLYPSLCLFEGTSISVGRGTYKPFQQIGHPSFSSLKESFMPVSIPGMSKYPKYQDKLCYGKIFSDESTLKGIDLSYLITYYNLFEDKDNFFVPYFNTLAGNSTLQAQIVAGKTEKEIKASWQKDLVAYKLIRKKYLLYPDFE